LQTLSNIGKQWPFFQTAYPDWRTNIFLTGASAPAASRRTNMHESAGIVTQPSCNNRAFTRLFADMDRDGVDLSNFARYIGVAPILLQAIADGHRPASNLPPTALRLFARYLHLAPAQLFMWAGVICDGDFLSLGDTAGEPGSAHAAIVQQYVSDHA
jgi:hypothetical protein